MKFLERQLNFEPEKGLDMEGVFDGINHVVKLLSASGSLKETLKSLIIHIEAQVKDVRCSILLIDDTGKYLHKGAAPNLPESYCDVLDGFLIGPTMGSCGAAAYKNEMVVIDNIETHPLWSDFKGPALANNLKACWSTPIVDVENRVLGTLCPYFSEPRVPSEEEIKSVQLASYLAGIAIQLDGRDKALRKSEARYELLFNHMKFVMEGTSSDTGEDFLKSLIANLASSLNMKFGFLGECKGDIVNVRFIWADGQHGDKFNYQLSGTPCEIVISENRPLLIGEDVQKKFPEDHLLVEFGIESYFGVPICDPSGEVIANLVVMDNKPHFDTATFELILSNFASRAEIELFRGKMEQQMIESKEFAEKANKAKTEFLSRMSHELRTPMNAILGFTQLLTMDTNKPLAGYQKENLERISSAGAHLLTLINEVLDLATIESGKIELSIEPVDISLLIRDLISTMKPLADEHRVSLYYKKSTNERLIAEIDSLRFKQVALNLISNAIKFNKPNGIVEISIDKQNENWIRLGVKDSGKGIPINYRENLFIPFERLDVKYEFVEGTGIGLAISKHFVELMKGSIGFESVVGEGSFFFVDMPISDQTPLQYEDETSIVVSSTLTKTHEKKILYIDDISINLELVSQIINSLEGVKLMSTSNPISGIELAQAEIPDLILMDIQMPGMNGLDAFNKLQAFDETKNIPVIALTSDAMDGDIKKALDMGFADYITKPIEVPKFVKTINEFLA
jgi:signal transduction histidine kinase